ncbi:acyl-CoA dehydrogenase family protein [Rhodococcus sp. BP22]|uniref:acyl-CoA dehydrogenase family protein n=1 Tax=Rhodococcus sp. BP22 TaxID=2758566 RepID=UPI001645258F|nr:acyl-CoA dehydrogenase family protein [Rhodococcus sp. BP22]
MDFSFSEEQRTIGELAADVFGARASTDRIVAVEASTDRIDRDLWDELGRTGVLGIAVSEEFGGSALDFSALCVVLVEQGRRVAPVPLWPHLVSALVIGEFGTENQKNEWLPAATDGSKILTVGLEGFGPFGSGAPSMTAAEVDGVWRVTGSKVAVPSVHVAARVVVSAETPSGPALFLLDPSAEGVSRLDNESTTHELCADITAEGARVDILGAADGSAVGKIESYAEIALAAVQLGVAESAVKQAVAYLNERVQFGRPLATFQAVGHQLADCYIDIEAMRVTLWQAAWLLSAGEDPGTSVLVAKWWASDAGARVVHRTQHVHGGIGVDTDYPIHRYLLWGKQIGATLGGAASDLNRLGDLLATGVEVIA